MNASNQRLCEPAIHPTADASTRTDYSLPNFLWMLVERGIRVAGGLILTILIARHLGPRDFGILGYALAFSSIFSVIAAAGVDDILTRDFARKSLEPAAASAAAAWRLRMLMSLIAIVGTAVVAWLWHPSDTKIWTVVMIVASAMFFSPWDVVYLWFQARSHVRRASCARIVAFSCAALVRIVLLVEGAPLVAFASVVAAEALLAAIGFHFIARARRNLCLYGLATWKDIGHLSTQSAPLLLSGLLVIVAMQVDRLLLVRWQGEGAAGVYLAGIRITETLHAVPQILGAVLLPKFARAQRDDGSKGPWALGRRVAVHWVIVTSLGALSVSMFAASIVPWLFGHQYDASAHVFAVHGWSLLFVGLVSIRSRLFVVVSKGGWILTLSICTAVVSVLSNVLLIPRLGPVGAAWAAVITWGSAATVMPWLFPQTRLLMNYWLGRMPPRPSDRK